MKKKILIGIFVLLGMLKAQGLVEEELEGGDLGINLQEKLKKNFLEKEEFLTDVRLIGLEELPQKGVELISRDGEFFIKIKNLNSGEITLLAKTSHNNIYTITLTITSKEFKKIENSSITSKLQNPSIPLKNSQTATQNTTGIIDGDLLNEDPNNGKSGLSVFIIILLSAVVLVAVGVVSLFLFSEKEEETQLRILNGRNRTRLQDERIQEVNEEHLSEKNWQTEEREAYLDPNFLENFYKKEPIFDKDKGVRYIDRPQFEEIREKGKKNFVQFEVEKDTFDPNFQPEFDYPGRIVGSFSPYVLPDFQKPHYFPYADVNGIVVTNNGNRGDKERNMDLGRIEEIDF